MRKIAETRQRGFTLLELMVALIFIAVLASIGVPIYMEQVKSARAADAQTTIGAIKTAGKMYLQKYGQAPRDVNELTEKGFIDIDEATDRQWKFELTLGRDKIEKIRAVSTEEMAGGAGNEVEYDLVSGKWRGYGQPESD